MKISDYLWSRVEKTETCWNWTGPKLRGYGSTSYKGRKFYAHRLSYQISVGPIPSGLQVLHKCDNPSCVRPDHLFLGTQQENLEDMRRKGRGYVPPGGMCKGSRHGKAKLSPNQVIEIRRMACEGVAHDVIAKSFPVGRTQISRIIRGSRWAVVV